MTTLLALRLNAPSLLAVRRRRHQLPRNLYLRQRQELVPGRAQPPGRQWNEPNHHHRSGQRQEHHPLHHPRDEERNRVSLQAEGGELRGGQSTGPDLRALVRVHHPRPPRRPLRPRLPPREGMEPSSPAGITQKTVSVSNLDETAANPNCAVGRSGASRQCAIAFSTGDRSNGYTLKDITARQKSGALAWSNWNENAAVFLRVTAVTK